MAALFSVGLMSSALADTPPASQRPNKPPCADCPQNQEKFAEHKQEMLKRMEQRKSCVESAQTPSDMKACHKGDGHPRMPRRDGANQPEGGGAPR